MTTVSYSYSYLCDGSSLIQMDGKIIIIIEIIEIFII